MQNPETRVNARGAAYTRGTCPVCGTGLMRFGGANTDASPHPPEVRPETEARAGPANDQSSPAAGGAHTPARGATRKSAKNRRNASEPSARKPARSLRAGAKPGKGATRAARPAATGTPGVPLVIVESPAKAKTIGRFLGRQYIVRASVGHIRDLPEKTMGVDIEHGFRPHYVIPPKKKKTVQELKGYAASAPEVYLATDPDREGEAIAWHLQQTLGLADRPVQRVEFHEITQQAISNAFAHPRALDLARVDSQQARRVLDRIVGYSISPLLRKKMSRRGLSAGRVQSVALRLVVEREREIQNFVPVEYWSIEAELAKQKRMGDGGEGASASFRARLVKIGDKDFECHAGEEAYRLKETLEQCRYVVLEVRRKDVTRNPAPPFITSTLQQEASRKLGFNPKRTMKVAQELYEGLNVGEEGTVGLITYMRTDSTQVSEEARKEAWAFIRERLGEGYLPRTPRVYGKKVAGAQEAHEAIRPTRTFREPAAVKPYLDADQYRLYDLIWKRFVASQMASAILDTTAVDIGAYPPERPITPTPDYVFRANGSIVKFDGFLRVYAEGRDEKGDDEEGRRLPELAPREPLDLLGIFPEQHFTEPPPRFTEASLIKALEQHGIGRPSTYAPILTNIQERGYLEQIEGRRLRPTELGFAVSDHLVAHFPEIVDLGFTARMEEKLDEIAGGGVAWGQVLQDFYGPFKQTLDRAEHEMPATRLEDEKTDRPCPQCGAPLVIKRGRFGRFMACSAFPKCRYTASLTTGVRCPECSKGELAAKRTRTGRTFFGCSRYPDCKFATWDEPLPDPCPRCGGLLTINKGICKCTRCDYRAERTTVPEGATVPASNAANPEGKEP